MRASMFATMAGLVLGAGCGPVRVKTAWGQPPAGEMMRDLVVINIRDLRGQDVSSAAATTLVDLPDSVSTTATSYGSTTTYTSTYSSNDVTILTGQTMGTSLVNDVRGKLYQFMTESEPFEGVPLVDEGTVLGFDDRGLGRVSADTKKPYVAIIELADYRFTSDADGDVMLWAYLGGLTLGLITPFIPAERWNASVKLTGNVFIWSRGQGIVARQPLNLSYGTRGPGVPGYGRVFSGVSNWADTRISEDILEAIVAACRQAGCAPAAR